MEKYQFNSKIRFDVSASKDPRQHPQAVGRVSGGELEAEAGHDLHEAGAGGHQAAVRGRIPGLCISPRRISIVERNWIHNSWIQITWACLIADAAQNVTSLLTPSF